MIQYCMDIRETLANRLNIPMPTMDEFMLLTVVECLGAVLLPVLLLGTSGARLCGVRGISQLEGEDAKISPDKNLKDLPTYPLANMGVSGKLQEVWRRLSSRGLCAARLGKPLEIKRLREVLLGKSEGNVPGP